MNDVSILSGETRRPRSADGLLKKSLLYREFEAEHEEILRHKWLESEKVGRDIGFELAQMDWRLKHRSQWHRERQGKHISLTFEI